MKVTLVSTQPDTASGTGQYTDRLAAHLGERVHLDRVSLPTDIADPRPFLAGAFAAGDTDTDVVHVQFDYVVFGPFGLFVLFFFPILWARSRRHEFAVVTTVHEVLNADLVTPPLARLKRLYVRLLNETVARTTKTIFLSPEAESRFVASVGDTNRQRLSLGAETSPEREEESQDAARAAFDIGSATDVVVTPGYVSPRKGSDVVAAVARRCPDIEFLLAGGPPRDRHTPFFDRVADNAPPNLTVTGRLSEDDFHRAFVAGDIALLPYRELAQTGVVNAVNQSDVFNWCASYGLPVLAGDCAHFRTVADKWDAPRLVDPTDSEAVSASIQQVLNDSDLRRQLASAMTAYAQANSMSAVVKDHLAVYHELKP